MNRYIIDNGKLKGLEILEINYKLIDIINDVLICQNIKSKKFYRLEKIATLLKVKNTFYLSTGNGKILDVKYLAKMNFSKEWSINILKETTEDSIEQQKYIFEKEFNKTNKN